jgi:hypothetical protein
MMKSTNIIATTFSETIPVRAVHNDLWRSVPRALQYVAIVSLCVIAISVETRAQLSVSAPSPSPQSASTDSNVAFTVNVSGQSGTLTYIWQFSPSPNDPAYIPLSDGKQASGSTVIGSATATLKINNAQPGDRGRYRCLVSNATGQQNSGPGTLNVSNVEMKLRIMPVDGPTRRADTSFQMGATSGFSVDQLTGDYFLYGPSALYENAWNVPNGSNSGVIALRFGGDGWCTSGKLTCDPTITPTTTDNRCGDTAGLFSKSVNSSVPSWLYQNNSTGTQSRLQPFPAQGVWPSPAPPPFPPPTNGVCQLSPTGITGWNPVISAAAINEAFPNPQIPLPASCTARKQVNPNSFATGAADAKVVYVGSTWYMAFSETINNPMLMNGSYVWTSTDLFLVGWATSTDGRNWTFRHQLFQTSMEQSMCNAALLVTQLIVDNGFFYMLADEVGGKGLILFRAPIDTGNADGFDSNAWQLETQEGTSPITWTNVPTGSMINTSDVLGNNSKVQAVSIAPVPAVVQQGALQRVFNNTAANSTSQIVLVATEDLSLTNSIMNVWTAPDFGQAFTLQSTIDTSFINPKGAFGWEFGFTYFPNQTSTTPLIVANEFDFWLIGDTSGGVSEPTGAQSLTGYRSTATVSGGTYSPRAAFFTSGGDYISVTGSNVSASQTSTGSITTFVVLDANVSLVQSGDAVNLQASNGDYISATNGGGSTAVAVPGQPGTNETFTIVKTAGSGAIMDGDSVAFRSSGGYYLTAQSGGGGAVDFPTTTVTPAATFVYKIMPL